MLCLKGWQVMKKKSKRAKMLQTILYVPDVHRKYHDERAWQLMLQVANDVGVDKIRIMGDFMDFYAVSSFSKDPSRASQLDEDINSGNQGLDQLDALGATDKVYIAGNHEDRLERYLKDKAPQLFNMVKLEKLLKLEKRGWKFVPYKDDNRTGKMYETHDVGVAGRYAIYKSMELYQHNSITAHTHRMAYAIEGNASGEMHLAASFGWLGDAKMVDYAHRARVMRDCVLGFGLGYLDEETGNVFAVPVPIIRYQCVVNGKLYQG